MSSSGSDSDSSSKIDAPQTTKKGSKKSAPSAAPAVVDKGKGKSKATISSDEEEESSDESSDDDDDDDEMAGRSARPAVIKVSKDLQYKPPSNMLPLTIQQSTSPFDYDRLANNPNLELWLIRVPDSLKPRHLSNLTITSAPSSSSSSRTTTGSLSTKTHDYTLKSVESAEAAEELVSLKPLLPSKAKGGYMQAPRPPTTLLVLSPTLPIVPTTANPLSRYVPPVKPPRVQPTGKLQFRNKPFGYDHGFDAVKVDGVSDEGAAGGGEADVSMEEVEAAVLAAGGKKTGEKTKKRKAAAVEAEGGEAGEKEEKKKSKKSKKEKEVVA